MIKYNLKCNDNHEFESWFSDSKDFKKKKKIYWNAYIYLLKNQ